MTEKTSFSGKRLYRSRANRMLAGVCGGLAEYLEVDPTLVRLVCVALVFMGGFGLLVYVASAIIVPNNPEQQPSDKEDKLIKDKSLFWGSLLIIFGIFLLLKQTGMFYGFHFWNIPWEFFWGLVLIGLGAYLLLNKKRDAADESSEGMFDASKLFRSSNQKMIAGVCGGLAEYFNFDVSLVRILFVVFAFLSGGIGILIYIVMAVVFPLKPAETNENQTQS